MAALFVVERVNGLARKISEQPVCALQLKALAGEDGFRTRMP